MMTSSNKQTKMAKEEENEEEEEEDASKRKVQGVYELIKCLVTYILCRSALVSGLKLQPFL